MKENADKRKPAIAILGTGSLAGCLVPALAKAGYRIAEIIVRAEARPRSASLRRARALAAKVRARVVTVESASLEADLLWLCVPDREIGTAAKSLARRVPSSKARFAFHSSGALGSGELGVLRAGGMAVASVHPLMTFVHGARATLKGVPFALEGDVAALRVATRIVSDLGGEGFLLSSRRKAAYHAWATMTSPLLVAYLVALEEAARQAGLEPESARRMSLPIIRQTLANYGSLGPGQSFSGPFVRGDATTVEKHLTLLKNPKVRAVYVALARVALARLPVSNKKELRRRLAE